MNTRAQQIATAGRPEAKPTRFSFGPSLLDIACGHCGHQADAEQFTRDGLGQWRAVNEFQCPQCKRAWRILLTPYKNTLKPIAATL